jgi:lipopolysaccharide transport system ATP-binding protein
MSQYAIQTQGLGKQFRVSKASTRGMHEAIERLVREPFTAFRSSATHQSKGIQGREPSKDNCIWALRDVSFEVTPGEVVGVLGANGAGKSVLLKILSRVTAPTEGSADIYGNVAPLLEVGAGFHPELTGRENVYFNGTILGMDRDQIRRKFDDIVAFSEIEQFIDMPVKFYSSGMRIRLAFSIAVHLEPEILLIDETLAVGDASFRAKCRRKLAEFVARGCTLLMVSHDETAIADMCERAILFSRGRMIEDGDAADVLRRYREGGWK